MVKYKEYKEEGDTISVKVLGDGDKEYGCLFHKSETRNIKKSINLLLQSVNETAKENGKDLQLIGDGLYVLV